jgi:DNA-directed RNA polymerase specialized sigma24 family protein
MPNAPETGPTKLRIRFLRIEKGICFGASAGAIIPGTVRRQRGYPEKAAMSSEGSVTGWLAQLREGDAAAAQQLWERYFQRLVGLARKRLQGVARRVADEEDVALSAFTSFCHNAERGRFPQLLDRDSLWRLLVVITGRKAAHLVRAERCQKRGGDAPAPEAPAGDSQDALLDQVLSREPSPEFAAQVADEYQRLLHNLGDEELRSVALCKMEGYTVEEMAARLGYAPRSIKRKLQLIRGLWEKEIAP